MKIREADEADLPPIVGIYNDAIATRISTAQLDPVTVEERRPWFREHHPEQYPLRLVEIDGRVAGWLSFHPFVRRTAYRGTVEVSVYVHENFRRRGLARALLQEGIARAPALRMSVLLGLIFGHNQPSLDLFERFGFERWGLLPAVANMEGTLRDVVVLGRRVGSPNE